jgi:N-dimethylarginine dimethylaminohydrolase
MQKILMCRPTYFDVSYDINPWMTDNTGTVHIEMANKQWNNLYEALREVADVRLIEPVEGLPDMVFTANAGFYDRDRQTVFLSHFRHKERKEEEKFFRMWFKDRGFDIVQSTVAFEGEGDLLYNGHYWLGYGFRSDFKYNDIVPFNTHHLHMVDDRFYHLDTCFAPLKNSGVLWFPGAFSEDSQLTIKKYTNDLASIEVDEEQALTFCCNAVVIGDHVFMPKCKSVAKRLEGLGYTVHQFDMSEFLKSGGACKCLTMLLD